MASSIDEHEGSGRKNKKEKDRKPANTAFRQQRLKAWQPILTPKTVLPLFFIIGIIFAPIGGLLLYASAQVQELVIDYTDCDQAKGEEVVPSDKFTANFKTALDKKDYPKWTVDHNVTGLGAIKTNPNFTEPSVCNLTFTLPNELNPPIYVYYRLTNFFQNHRRYVQSSSEDQLKGKALSKNALHGSCNPLDGSGDKPYYPCGLIANSQFNDTFANIKVLNPAAGSGNAKEPNYNFTNKGIAWASDSQRFETTKYNYTDVLPPPDWHFRYPNNYTQEFWPPNFKEDEELQVWMRTAGLPTFSKLSLRNDNETMQKATYRIQIYYRFPVREFKGTKSIVITTRTVMGGKNPFLGIAYVVVGGLCILLGAAFTARHLFKPRKLGDHTYLSWNNDDQAGNATATGRDH